MPIRGFRKTHCWLGHSMTGDNLVVYTRTDGYVEHRCQTCRKLHYKKSYPAAKIRRKMRSLS